MNWLHDHEEDLHFVFAEARERIAGFPAPLSIMGLRYLEGFSVFTENSSKNYICYLLPFWLQNGYGLSPLQSRRLSVGNVMLMLYFFIQDDWMDDSFPGERNQLPLANLLFTEFLDVYRDLFPGSSPFWNHYKTYIHQWADSVIRERQPGYFIADKLQPARKASPLKLSATAVLLLGNGTGDISRMEHGLDHALLTLQLLDDYEDWQEDLAAGNANCLLAMIASGHGCSPGELTVQQVKDDIMIRGTMSSYAEVAASNHLELAPVAEKAPSLSAFHRDLADDLERIAGVYERERTALKQGGLFYWLSKKTQQNDENT